ncbi:MAG TPA: bifunctional alpha/beta hydrolase/class I SAM-dependent methyltransferase [Chthoniobacterales bacterium]|nr:bifunctional alpha/beta hydrolase/class I SAM-dependent methyltransferase [Chthoniobacterales bacterium]
MQAVEATFETWDAARLFYRAWIPEQSTNKALLLFHRGHEHSGRWSELVETLGLDDVAIFAWDARGHGRSDGERGAADNFGALIKDVDAFVRHVRDRHGFAMEDMILLAHSVAGVTVSAWVHDYAPPIRALILATPAFRVRLYVPLAIPSLRLKQKFLKPGFVKSYVKGKMLTHDPIQAAQYEADPLIFRQIAVNVLIALHDAGTRLLADAGAIHVPTLMLSAGRDWVVSLKAQREFFNGLSSPVKRMHVFPAAYHALFHELERAQVADRVRDFVRERFASPVAKTSLLDADKYGHTWEEYERLKLRGSPHFAVVRGGMKTGGRLSEGIDLGWRSGFDSGLTLDYVYENKARGRTPLGRLIDRNYLNSPGWRGIRERRKNLETLLRRVIEEVHAQGLPVRILDVAAGGGRYVLETMQALRHIPMTAVLRDYKEENVRATARRAAELGLTNVTVEIGDAFDRAALAAISPRPTIAIVSGLFELFPNNSGVLQSLGGLAEAIEPGGYLIYTNQPWHPQVEFIARVLRNREGKPWIMRRRTTAEMDELVRATGFDKTDMEVDEWGMFSVSVARLGGSSPAAAGSLDGTNGANGAH